MTEFNVHYPDLLQKLGYQMETTTIQAVDCREQAKPAVVLSGMAG
jgi:hypothetical protein